MAESRIFDGSNWITITDEEHRNASDPHQLYALADGTRGDFAPTDHGHVLADISDYTAPDLSGLVQDTDPRLSDARPPLAHDHTIADVSGLQAALDGKQSAVQPINAQTGTGYTLQASDAGKLVTLTNAAAITLTVPAVLSAGQRVDCVVLGEGMVTVVGSGVTVTGTPSLVSRAQWSAFSVVALSASTCVVVGDLA